MLQLASTMNSEILVIILKKVVEIKSSIAKNKTKLVDIEMNSNWGEYIKVRYE